MHESQCHEVSSFVTLTYAAAPLSLRYRDFQLFMKRLIDVHKRNQVKQGVSRADVKSVRFFMCGEYGELGRPHFHACLFGLAFTDRKRCGLSPGGTPLYRSALLERLWPHGFSSVGDVTFESAAYVARYTFKKVTGKAATEHYRAVDVESGEVIDRVPEFCHMSLRPGIGAPWFDKFWHDVMPRDYVVVNGVKASVPRYYSKKYAKMDDAEFAYVKYLRERNAASRASDNTSDRLAVKEKVTLARLNLLKRSLE